MTEEDKHVKCEFALDDDFLIVPGPQSGRRGPFRDNLLTLVVVAILYIVGREVLSGDPEVALRMLLNILVFMF